MTSWEKKAWPEKNLFETGPRHRSKDPNGSGTHRRPFPRVSLRTSALTFLDGALEGWDVHQLVTWTDQCLIRAGRLITANPFPSIQIQEPEFDVLSYGMPNRTDTPSSFLSHARAPELARRARRRVVESLEGLLQPNPQDRFVQAALYDGRVVRSQGPGGNRVWDVMLTERHALSDQILALLAADLLDHREEYEQHLILCRTCEKVDFWPERTWRRGCPEHPEAVGDVLRQRLPTFG